MGERRRLTFSEEDRHMTGWLVLIGAIILICQLPARVVMLGLNVLIVVLFVAMFVQQKR
jgi:hypothetical protein